MPTTPPRLLSIAGSDSGGGAGIQADLKTFAAHGAYGMSVVTAVTAQNTVGVIAVHEVPASVVAAQLDAVFADIGVDAVKVGMLASASVVRAVAERLAVHLPAAGSPPVVVDPVMVAKSGDALLRDDAVAALLDELVPLATLITPNLPEAARLSGLGGEGEEDRRRMARALAESGPAVLVKGGHAASEESGGVVDLLLCGGRLHAFRHPRVATTSDHGTGCTLSSAIAARLAAGETLPVAVEGAIAYLLGALRAAYPLGRGRGPVDHFYRLRGGGPG